MLKKLIILFSWLVLGPIPGTGQFGSVISAVERAEIALETNPERARVICDSLNALPLTALESAYVNFTLSDAYYYLEDIRGSSRAAAEALRVMPDSFPLAKQITLYNSQGQNLDILGKMDSAIWHYQRGITLARRVNDSLELSDLYFNLGTVYNKQLAYNQALTYLDSSYQIDLMLEDSSKLSSLLRYIGFLQMRYYDYDAAKSQLIKALNFANNDDPAQSCVVLTTLGTLHEQLGEVDSLRHYLELARDCYAGIEDHTTIHYLYKLEGEYYLLARDTLNARSSFEKSSRIAGQIGDETGRIMTNLQSLELRNDTTEKTLNEIKKLLVKAADYGATNVLYRGYELLADRLAEIGRFEAALSARNQAATYLKEYNLSKNQRMVQGQAVRFDVFQKEQQISLAEERIKSQRSQWVAIVAFIVVISGGLWAWTYYRRKRKDLNQQRLRLEKETELQRKITEIEGQAFRAQMNPHFIFNALNSVKGLIVTGRDKEAAVYISRFSKLVRSVLDQSRNKTISLREELETLELYLQLEQLRFRDGFVFTNKVAADVNAEDILLPAVVIQPFAENSIWHGFRGNNRDNELIISVSIKAEDLIISIEDNGIGREAAAANAQKEHHSHGIEITRQRLLNFSGPNHKSVIHYDDLKTEDGKFALGTRVTLKIPLRYD